MFSDSVDSAIEKYSLQKVSLLRAFCKMVGIQILLHEYSLDGKTRQAFYEEDIQNVFPIVKNVHPKVGTFPLDTPYVNLSFVVHVTEIHSLL